MQFDVQVKDALGLNDADFRAMDRAELMRILDDELPTVQRAVGRNLCNDNLPSYFFRHIMSGGGVANPYTKNGVGSGGLASINLHTDDGEPGYTEGYEYYGVIHYPGNDIGTGNSGKRFIDDDVDAHLIRVEPALKEELQFRSRFLYLPAEAVSGNIRSVVYHYAHDANSTTSAYRGPFGRFRLKDSGGNPIIISKSSSQVLQIQVLLKLVTI